MSIGATIGLVIRLFVLLSPFCTLSLFLGCSGDMGEREQRGFGIRIALAIWIICVPQGIKRKNQLIDMQTIII